LQVLPKRLGVNAQHQLHAALAAGGKVSQHGLRHRAQLLAVVCHAASRAGGFAAADTDTSCVCINPRWALMSNPFAVNRIGLAWYELDDFEHIKAAMEDAHLLPQVYSLWRLKAEQTERELRRQGKQVVRAPIRAADFVAWCGARGLHINAAARMEYAAWFAAQTDAQRH
jgi:hypothetical protein